LPKDFAASQKRPTSEDQLPGVPIWVATDREQARGYSGYSGQWNREDFRRSKKSKKKGTSGNYLSEPVGGLRGIRFGFDAHGVSLGG
jgi:hypothetical protein